MMTEGNWNHEQWRKALKERKANQRGTKFQNNLRFYRKQTGLTAKDFAAQLNINYGTYNSYESAGKEPKYDTLCKIATALHVSIDDLIGYKPPAKCKSAKNQLFNKKLKKAMNALADVMALTEAEGEC